MSRIDDYNAERRAEEARVADQKAADLRARERQKRATESSAFDRALAQRSSEQVAKKDHEAKAKETKTEAKQAAQGAIAMSTAASAATSKETAFKEQTVFKKEIGWGESAPNPRTFSRHGSSNVDHSPLTREEKKGRIDSAKGAASTYASSGPEANPTDNRNAVEGIAASENDQGSGGESDSGDSSKQENVPFRLPPAALMAPPPLARPKDPAAARLSAITKEIIDKIVSRVLVGTNRQGAAEFRVELKSTVLKGLSIRISSGKGGKIKATFSGSDREILAALKKSSAGLVEGLKTRGLSLEELVFEDIA